MEFGPVTFPAYAGATAGVRSITDVMLEKQLLGSEEQLERLADMIAQRASVNTQPFTVSFSNAAPYYDAQASPSIDLKLDGREVANAVTKHQADAEPPENRDEEPEPSAATTPAEPEPSEATTHKTDERGLFWYAPETQTRKVK